MAADDRPDGTPGDGQVGDPDDYRYYGPFGPPSRADAASGSGEQAPTAPLGIGRWSYDEAPQSQPRARGDGSTDASTDETQVLPQGEPTQVLPLQPGPSYAGGGSHAYQRPDFGQSGGSVSDPGGGQSPQGPGWGAPLYPAPPGVQPLRPQSPELVGAPSFAPSSPNRRRPRRGVSLLLLAALLAALIGGGAGYAGSRLAARTEAVPQTTQPTATTGSTRAPSAPASPFTPVPGQNNTVQVAKAVLPSTVMIRAGSGTRGGTGSGFVLDDDGHIMTNNHVVASASDSGRVQVVYADGSRTTAELVGRSPSYDLAVIKVDPSGSLRPIRIGDSDASQIGESVIAIGSPLGLPGTVTAGIVSAKDRPVVVNSSADADAATAYINAIQTDAPINPGNSGGPLIDSQARVIGVNSAILTLGEESGQSGSIGLGFAIPINQAMEIGELLIKDGKATYPVIGVNVGNRDSDDGVELTTVEPGGPAADAGLKPGDVITEIDGDPVTDIQSLIVTIRTHRPGERVTLTYERSGTSATSQVILGSKEG